MATDDATVYRRRLPQWRAGDAVYFVTWRLAQRQSNLSANERDLLVTALRQFDLQRYQLIGYVVMNDHVHVVVEPATNHDLTTIVQSWKSYTANRMRRIYGRTGRFWQREYFDRVIRDDEELHDRLAYILGNPGKRWPDIDVYSWVWVAGI
ncbi:MAG TPA: transposase [Candidatus Binataceae bacterium]|jgi:REP element-mobilizing transposase RayT|nr:transposase [Candidatus Binataceae bacterium]